MIIFEFWYLHVPVPACTYMYLHGIPGAKSGQLQPLLTQAHVVLARPRSEHLDHETRAAAAAGATAAAAAAGGGG